MLQTLAYLGVQGLYVVGMGIYFFSFHLKTRFNLLSCQVLAIAIWLVHFWLISAWTGVALTATSGVITACLVFKPNVKFFSSHKFLVLALCTSAVATAFAWEGYHSSFSLAATWAIILARWQEDVQKIRLCCPY